MEQLTEVEAAEKYCIHAKSPIGSLLYIHKMNAFKAGAEWQKEQYKLLCKLAFEAANVCDSEGAVELCDEIKTELDRLESA